MLARPTKVKSVKKVGRAHCYDFEMASPHNNYFANGCLVHNTQGISQLLKGMKPYRLEDLSAAIALYRPGVIRAGLLGEYMKRRSGKVPVVYVDPRLEPILEETFGVMVYQEQPMRICTDLAGYTAVEADNMRSIIGKKKFDKMQAEGEKFMAGCVAHGMEAVAARRLFDNIKAFAAYGFNRSHSISYGLISYWTAYLKANYAVEMMTALLNTDPDKLDLYVKECKRLGIKVSPPHVNLSQDTFTIVDESETESSIVFGLQGIKFLGEKAAESIKEGQPYTSVEDFFDKNPAGQVNKRNVEILIKLGAFEGLTLHGAEMTRADLLYMFSERGKKKTKKGCPSKWVISEVEVTDDDSIVWPVLQFDDETLLIFEQEYIGIGISFDPLERAWERLGETSVNDLDQIEAGAFGGAYVVLGMVVKAREHKTKKGDTMAFLTVETREGDMIEVVAFPEVWAEHKSDLKLDGVCLVEVRKQARGENYSLNIEKAVKVEHG